MSGSRLSIVSAYFTSATYGRLSATLEPIHSMRFLFGEPRFLSSIESEYLNPPAFTLNEDNLALTEQLRQRSAARSCSDWIRSKVDVRSIRRAGLLHGKMIHVHDGAREHAMVGSSNFTLKGLGLIERPNIELNLVVDGDRDRKDLLSWFDEIWADEALTVDVKDEVLRHLEQMYRHSSPEFIYQKTLFHLFEEFLDDQAIEEERLGSIAFSDTAIWHMLYRFQRDGVRAVLGKLDRHGGCILADSVGLGKTLTALAVIKYHESRNQRVLVLCPKKLRENWTEYLAGNNSDLNPLRDDKFNYTVLSHTDLTRERGHVGDIDLSRINWAAYDLVVIDESHAFRNAAGSRYQRLIDEVVRAGVPTRVLMLSATPVNNDLADLKAQLGLIAKGKSDAFRSLGAPNLSSLIGDARRRFAEWTKSGERDAAALMARLPPALTTLLDGVSIARSRRHIERHYADTLDEIGRFPARLPPLSRFPGVDLVGSFPTFDEIDREIGQLNLALYNPFAFVLLEYRERYNERDRRTAGFDQANREKYLIAMMKIGFLKRLESSVSSFGHTMERIVGRIDRRLAEIEAFRDSRPAISALETEFDDEMEGDEDLASAFEVGGRLKYDLRHIQTDVWEAALRQDRERVAQLAATAAEVGPERDAKLAQLKELVSAKAWNPTINRDGARNRKVILFTAFSDTARYLYRELEPLARSHGMHSGLVTGSGCQATVGKARFQDVLANFAPRSKKRAAMRGMPEAEIDLLIATDCISEGQNLQDADLLVNVDIHWNPVRLIQRFGRIDRIGSQTDTVQMVNFWPTEDLNRYLNLKDRVEARMALVDLSATGEDNLLAEARDAAEGEFHWRDEQLRRLQTEVFDLEEAGEGVSLTEFTLDEFRADLLAYARKNADQLRDAPLGLHALTPVQVEGGRFEPGVIFCLRRKGEAGEANVNPLEPFYLVYVRDDGSIRHGFSQPKSILTALEALCSGRSKPFEALCDAFDDETEHGAKLERYDRLSANAVADIGRAYAARAAAGLAMGRGGKLDDSGAQARIESEYELITWLIVRPGDGSAG
ncbi:ATP-dependent helicase HEPA [Mesorhizobium alhagi CCNWXJ12-2]|uniref:ATP-dependent helicase HEPA n=2 Tax=Allomesorhizobium alhagi TaxID=475067 RepID=H0I0A1_9HYPH|nr:ATP-dependent helicase HEPA [Mesorhizobium alhagi CCNWXJ12-2]